MFNFRENEQIIAITVSRIGSTEGAPTVAYELANETTAYNAAAGDTATDLKAPSTSSCG